MAQLSVDIENDFAPKYHVPDDKKDIVKTLKAAAAEASEIYLATDPDREGGGDCVASARGHRCRPGQHAAVVFHEITRPAIAEAFSHSRDLDMRLVNAQQARRILDRLVGYQVSPLLWERVQGRLSAGRVQSVALRLIVEREREILAFSPVEYWSLDAELAEQTNAGPEEAPASSPRLIRIRGKEADWNREDDAAIVANLAGAVYTVATSARRAPASAQSAVHHQHASAGRRSEKLGITSAHHPRGARPIRGHRRR